MRCVRRNLAASLVFAGVACLSALSCKAQAQAQTADWVWVDGSATEQQSNFFGVYGMIGVSSPANIPPGRDYPTRWIDSGGNLWFFAGSTGQGAQSGNLPFNDLWEFNTSTSEWTWTSGAENLKPVSGTYGQLGIPSPANVPGVREGSPGWIDSTGGLWLFGGFGAASLDRFYLLNDLWKFNTATAEWTWMGGNDTVPSTECLSASYGTLGVASATNLPVGRSYSAAWTDTSGNFWLFGGAGCDGNSGQVLLNDLWSYSPSTNEWTWEGGSSSGFTSGAYGILGVESSSNFPGSRQQSASWTDAAGDFWLFGGEGLDSTNTRGFLNDLWRFNPSTGKWAWMSGSDTIGHDNCDEDAFECARPGVYGVLGQPAAGNVPGGRLGSAGEVVNGNFLLFGGQNFATGLKTTFNDLWQFNPAAGEWAWIGGSDVVACGVPNPQGGCEANGEVGVYGRKGTPAATNYPGSRVGLVSWADKTGNFWIFGGDGLDSQGFDPVLNDLWKYQTPPLVTPPGRSAVTVTSSANPIFTANPLTLTAHVSSATTLPNSPTGTVQFSGGVLGTLGNEAVDASGNATLALASLPIGTYDIEASYSGDANNLASAGSITEVVGDFSLVVKPPASATINSGGTATFNLTLTPVAPITAFPAGIAFATSGTLVGAGITNVFSPASIGSGSAAMNVTYTVTIPAQPATSATNKSGLRMRAATLALTGFLLPFLHRIRREGRAHSRLPTMVLFLVAGLGAAFTLSGCGNRFYIGNPPSTPHPPPVPTSQTYSITITGSSGPLTHSETVTLVVN